MILSRKRPLRTYERKTAKKHFTNSLLSPVILIRKYNLVENDRSNDNETYNDSLNNDPFETTFDRIAKGAVVPPIPPDTNQNSTWKGSSSDSDINNSTNAIKSHEHRAFDFFTCNGLDTFRSSHSDTPKLTDRSIKITRKCKRLRRNESKVVISKGTVSKKATTMLKHKTQEQKRQRNKKQIKKMQSESSRMCNEQTSRMYSDDINNLEDITNMQTELVKIDNSAFKYTLNCQQNNVKPCFVALDACTVQNYILEKAVEAKQNMLCDTKFLCTDISSHIKKNISKRHSAILQSKSFEYDTIIGRFKHLSIKECFVVLHDNIIKNQLSKTEKSVDVENGSIEVKNKLNVPLTLHNLSPHNTNSTKLVPCDTKKNDRELIKDSSVKLKRLKVDEFVKKDNIIFSERERYIISSTPITKRVKSYACSASFSPINIDIHDTLYPKYECSISNVEEKDISIVLSNQKNSPSLIMPSKCSFDVDIHEHPTQVLQSSRKTQTRDSVLNIEPSSSSEDIHTLPMQKYKTENVIKAPSHSLNISSIADTDPSLFSDIIHDYSSKNTEVQKIHFTNTSTYDEIAHTTDSFVDLCQKHQQINNNANMKIENVNSEKSRILNESPDNVNNTALLKRLQDPIRITGRRMQYPKWHLRIQLDISKNSNDEIAEANSKGDHRDAINEIHDIQSEMYNIEHSTNAVKKSFDHVELFVDSAQFHDDANKGKSVFLKPGKYWARSLSILNRINDESNLDKLSLGKGKRWRHSVKDILDMQKQGIFQSCLKKDDDADLSCKELNTSNIISSFDDNKRKTFNSTNHARFSKRISVRVVPNNTSIGCKIKDTSFLEAFGIKSEKSPSLKLHRKESHDNRIIKGHSITARDVVLQRCSQNSYLSFSYCFPDSYLEYCRKIGEGVYGEVFLYEYLDKKSVIKVIPIEGEKLVNGEPQKKFNEILSEIVIAKELDNLRLNTTYKTSGFIEVRRIKCIMGKYPKRLVELWNTYDDNKTSDNDCPSMFDENQLYIALELGDGGEDLEAFVFQTAEEACALFLQTAFALAVAEKALEFEHRDLHWGNVLISRTKESYVSYYLDGKEIRLPSKGVKVSIIDFTLSRMLYQGCCIYNDLALDPALFTAHGEYQFEIYRLMREKIQNNWNKFEPYTNILWLHYTLDKMITSVRYKRKNLKVHKHAIVRLKEFKDIILNYDSAFDFATDSNVAHL
ncbi:uncharacterized protein LOC126859138 isoform X1 [Cataglyphis hispanica]|uniref:uncharacterized protein LOC126859138 isoform X1 n=1 Tax=Cataglyphis hispanica TaxID=1086592 RepID=UPI00217F2C6E|nr:uncharacterized protein LOC126859138 isoform X1 [Cataglyphis hispanica]